MIGIDWLIDPELLENLENIVYIFFILVLWIVKK